MSTLQRVDRTDQPLVVGRYYLVPVVTMTWHGHLSSWPVIGPPHTDVEFFNFTKEHYHIDGRFLSVPQWKIAEESYRTAENNIQSAPLHPARGKDLPKPTIEKRRCNRPDLAYVHGHQEPIQQIRTHFAGTQCERGKGGWICPHRKASLGSVAAVDGVITCPLHGLQIDAASGLVLSSTHRGSGE